MWLPLRSIDLHKSNLIWIVFNVLIKTTFLTLNSLLDPVSILISNRILVAPNLHKDLIKHTIGFKNSGILYELRRGRSKNVRLVLY